MKSHPTACPSKLRRRQRSALVACAFLLVASLPGIVRASELSACVQRKVHFDGSTPLNFYRVTGQPDTKLFIYPEYSDACIAGKGDCGQRGAYLITGNEVAVGKQCGSWSYIQYLGTRRITRGWVESARLQFLKNVRTADQYWQIKFPSPMPPSGYRAPPFRITRGRGTPVCEAYLQRLNTTDYQAGHVYPQSPFDGIPESDAVPGFALLHRVMLQPSAVIQISGPLFKWWYHMGPLDGGNADATPETIKLGGIVAWRYEPPLDINNDGKPKNLIVWRGYGLSGAAGRCGEPFIRYTWSMRCQQLPLVMKDDLHVNYAETVKIFGRISEHGSGRADWSGIRHPFNPVGFFITPFVYRGTTYFSAFFDVYGDYEGQRRGERKLWNTLGVMVRHQGRTREVCEYQMRGDDYPDVNSGLEN